MAATIIESTDIIDVSSLSILIYGPPGAWKTSLAQTALDPITLDFDKGAHRAQNRKTVMRFDRWADVHEAHGVITQKATVVVDTIGRLLDLLTADIIAANSKHGSAAGGLTLQGFGALKARFGQWINQLRLAGKDIVMLCHEKEEKDGDDRIMRPDIQGGSYVEVMKFTDMVGYLSVDRQGRRLLDFNPSDRHLGKNAAGWEPISVPRLSEDKIFLAELIADAKRRIGRTAEASAILAQAVEDWKGRLNDPGLTLDQLNAMVPEALKLKNGLKAQVWHLFMDKAREWELDLDRGTKRFTAKPKEPKVEVA